MPASLQDLMILTGYSRYEVRKLLSSGLLFKCIHCPHEAEYARFSRENLLEVCFIRAFDGCGVSLGEAARAARIWIEEERRGEFTSYFAWRPSRGLYADGDRWIHVFDDPGGPIVTICQEDDAVREEEAFHQSTAVIVINRGLIVRQVDRHIAGNTRPRHADNDSAAEVFEYRQAG